MVAIFVIALLTSGLAAGKAAGNQAWEDMVPAKTPEEYLKVAEAYPKAPVADWARIQAATEEYSSGIEALRDPKQRDLLAAPRLDKALDLFRQIVKDAPKDSSQALGAALGIARTLEARNKLPEAIEKYRWVASTYPNTPEAKQALALAKTLEDPVNVAFYKELYAYTPPTAGVRPSSTFPNFAPNFGTGSGSPSTKSFLNDIAPPPETSTTPPPPAPVSPGPAVEPLKAETKAPAPAPTETPKPATPQPDLPADPFAPK